MAALSRQHPRDLFDVHGLLANEGIDDAMRTAFVAYLLGILSRTRDNPLSVASSLRPAVPAVLPPVLCPGRGDAGTSS